MTASRWIASISAMLFVASAADGDDLKKPAPAEISLGIYSGERDPSWNPSEKEAGELAKAFAALGPVTKREADGGLGYHGFHLTGFRGYELVVVYDGVVEAHSGKRVTRWQDKERAFERLLLQQAKAHVKKDQYDTAVKGWDRTRKANQSD